MNLRLPMLGVSTSRTLCGVHFKMGEHGPARSDIRFSPLG
ncbi:MAG: hypothetical protein KatS3mg053_4047 [Candidatus Roseilinea sp.]|nr:MAG: hypothetical protein KatS3mg053_4047 [Candidatus Roseilinea sp.]